MRGCDTPALALLVLTYPGDHLAVAIKQLVILILAGQVAARTIDAGCGAIQVPFYRHYLRSFCSLIKKASPPPRWSASLPLVQTMLAA